MADESFLLVSLADEKSKKLSQVISNDTARRILDALAKKKYTESELAKELSMAISTVHYNIEQLKSAGLVKAKEYHYSSKGKEVLHYELVNKLIIISPGKEREGLFDTLKKFLPGFVIAGGVSIALEVYSKFSANAQAAIIENAPVAAPMMAKRAADTAAESAPSLMAVAQDEIAQTSVAAATQPNYALWFFIGAMSVLIAMFIVEMIKKRK